MSTETTNKTARKGINVRMMTVTAMMSAVAFVLMMFDMSTPVMPTFIKLDFSELPALIASFSMGPLSGVMVCLIKNLLHLLMTTTGGIGELSNFVLGACFVLPAGLIYKKWKNKRAAIIGALVGAALMAIVSVFSNYFVMYPFYYSLMPKEAVLAAYQALPEKISFLPQVDSILEALLKYNMPFTFVKGLFSVVITLFIYKPLSPIIKGVHR